MYLLCPKFSDIRMFIFGLSFVLHVLRLSVSKCLWKYLQRAETSSNKLSISNQKFLQKNIKAKLNIKFLKKCKSSTTHPKSVRWKNVKIKQLKEKNKQYHANQVNALKDRNNDLRSLTKKHDEMKTQFRQSTSWMKYNSTTYSLNRLQRFKESVIENIYQKKHDDAL